MTTGADLQAIALRYRGQPYSTAPARVDPASGIADCSGLIVKTLRVAGIEPGGTVSTTIETWAVRNVGRYISADEAARTPMCCAAIWGLGSDGHIGFSWGDGRVYETPSDEGRRVGFSRFWRNRWTRFFTLPGVDHHATGTTGSPRRYSTEMVILITPNLDQSWTATLVVGNIPIREFPLQPVGPYGIPQAAIEYAGDVIPIRVASNEELTRLKKIAAFAEVNPAPTTPGAPALVDVAAVTVAAETAATAAVQAAAAGVGTATKKATKTALGG